ncbi:hypothetical protein V4F54_004571 [Vibrio parahaemolyticus]|uniref:hypothetical protein n=1 Tax=Vibrio parahaemolyticus TaxID=670 RepID=UPI00084B4EF7|nr:hypothetical protein [Vibrio parahaemolyticus]
MKKILLIVSLVILSGCNGSKYPDGVNYISKVNKNVFINFDGNNKYSFNNFDTNKVITGKLIENDALIDELNFTIEFNEKPSVIPKNISLQANSSNLSLFKCGECNDNYEMWLKK